MPRVVLLIIAEGQPPPRPQKLAPLELFAHILQGLEPVDNLWITIGMLIAWPRVGMGLALVAIGMPLVTLAHLLLRVWG